MGSVRRHFPPELPRRSFLTGLAALPSAIGCAAQSGLPPRHAAAEGEPPATSDDAPPKNGGSDASGEPSLRFVGRVERSGPTQGRYAWSGCGFVARFEGTAVTLDMEDDRNQHTVVVDGRLVAPIRTERGRSSYDVARGLPAGEHVLEVYRRTEALFGPTTLRGVRVAGGRLLAPPRAPHRRVEIVGDSISCGYGNEGKDTQCSFSADTENHYLSYGAILARSLDAELSTVAWSGRGVVKNYDGEKAEHMPALYGRTLPTEPNAPWSFDAPANVVIVNLGTNDFSTEPDPSASEFSHAYAKLLTSIREKNPGAFVLCAIGPMLSGTDLERCLSAIDVAVRKRRDAGDARVQSHRIATPNHAPGCDWHPSLETHREMAAELEKLLRPHIE